MDIGAGRDFGVHPLAPGVGPEGGIGLSALDTCTPGHSYGFGLTPGFLGWHPGKGLQAAPLAASRTPPPCPALPCPGRRGAGAAPGCERWGSCASAEMLQAASPSLLPPLPQSLPAAVSICVRLDRLFCQPLASSGEPPGSSVRIAEGEGADASRGCAGPRGRADPFSDPLPGLQ